MTHSNYDNSKVDLIEYLIQINLPDQEIEQIVLFALAMAEGKRMDFVNAVSKVDSSFRHLQDIDRKMVVAIPNVVGDCFDSSEEQ